MNDLYQDALGAQLSQHRRPTVLVQIWEENEACQVQMNFLTVPVQKIDCEND